MGNRANSCSAAERTPMSVPYTPFDATGRPPQRASDADRERVAGQLQQAHAAGMLTLEETDERLAATWAARYTDELGPLVADLPVPHERPVAANAGQLRTVLSTSAAGRAVLAGADRHRVLALVLVIGLIALAALLLLSGLSDAVSPDYDQRGFPGH